MSIRTIGVMAACAVVQLAHAVRAEEPGESPHLRGFSVDFTQCTEFAGEGPVSLAVAQTLVPPEFTVAPVDGAANIVVRAASCASATVNGHSAQPTILSHIGINIVAPDGTGDINNYTVVYVSNNVALVRAFWSAGMPAHYDPQLTYEYSGTAATDGNLYVSATARDLPTYTIYGPETAPPPNSGTQFLANWWYGVKSRGGPLKMRQQTLFPLISFGTSSVTLYTDAHAIVGTLIGGNAFGDYSVLALRGVTPTGHMEVSFEQ